jgi:hypothetical protein
VHLTSHAGVVLERRACEPTLAYPDGYVEVVVDGTPPVTYRFALGAEVLALGDAELQRWQMWQSGEGLTVRETLAVPPEVARANDAGRLF